MVLSQDLRLRIVDLGIVDLVASGVSRRKAAARFKVIASSAIRPVPPFASAIRPVPPFALSDRPGKPAMLM